MMVSRIAYGDESIRRTGVPEPMYLLGAYIADDEQPDLADALSVYVRQAGKLHWRDHLPQTKLAVCRTINDYDASHLGHGVSSYSRRWRGACKTTGALLLGRAPRE